MIEDTEAYKDMLRMTHQDFLIILKALEPYITQQERCGGTKVATAAERLTLTIRFLATGESYRSLRCQFRISVSAICYIVRQVCEAICRYLGPVYLKTPSNNEARLEIAEKLERMWNFPNCVGAVDGKHIVFQAPPNCGSTFYNYKNTNFIVLLYCRCGGRWKWCCDSW